MRRAPQHSLLLRRTRNTSSSSSSESDYLELISIKPISYISLKDVLPSTVVNSPRPIIPHSPASEISIRNRLVKQAAWAYLQPMSASPGSAAGSGPFSLLIGFLNRRILQPLTRAFHWLLRAFLVGSSR